MAENGDQPVHQHTCNTCQVAQRNNEGKKRSVGNYYPFIKPLIISSCNIDNMTNVEEKQTRQQCCKEQAVTYAGPCFKTKDKEVTNIQHNKHQNERKERNAISLTFEGTNILFVVRNQLL